MKTVIYNIGTLAGILPADVRKLEGSQMNTVECIENAYLVIEDGVITEFGQNNGGCIGIQNNPSHDFVAGPSPCGQGGSTVLNTDTTTIILPKLRDDTVFNDQICILDALYSVHLRAFKLSHIRRQYACQCSYVVYNSFHGISALKCLIYSVLNVYAC
jgi:hypothetical protein